MRTTWQYLQSPVQFTADDTFHEPWEKISTLCCTALCLRCMRTLRRKLWITLVFLGRETRLVMEDLLLTCAFPAIRTRRKGNLDLQARGWLQRDWGCD